ncbi:phage tail protein X [Sphingomonas kyeonggiensis]|uniref:tail protein X n=1 Tax=Sphingomonas kyeonggiensis TaxID=1268553 RepID=UPI00277F8FA3|nr:tail protein X [Sphingomonas kyeonggiensis]MDQ0250974.1 phage tail protein X [Sphingomonas kyeonggiensis]
MSLSPPAFAGETLDALVWRATGGGPEAVERTLAANPGLADLASALPEGLEVTIPDNVSAPATAELVQLWDL